MKHRVLGVFIFLTLSLPCHVFAHGTDYRLLEDESVVVGEFFYADKEPMRYSKVLIFSPENDKVEFQNGRTDQKGRFAFCPSHPGTWRINVNDGVGHAVHAHVTVKAQATSDAAGFESESADSKSVLSQASVLNRILFGLSILLNIFFGINIWKQKRRKEDDQ